VSDSGHRVTGNLRIVSLCTIASRILGLIRDMAMAARFGNGPILDAFTVAFRLPNLARAWLGEGALTTAFLPAFVAELQQRGVYGASRLAAAMSYMLTGVLCGLVLIAELTLWLLGQAFSLGEEAELLRSLTAILLPYVIFICLAAQWNAVLHSHGRFFWPSLVPVVLNVVWLACLWGIVPQVPGAAAQMMTMCACVVAAGIAQWLFPMPLLWKLGYRLRADLHDAWPQVRVILLQMLPVLAGLSVTQFNTLVDSLLAWGFSRPEHGGTDIPWWPGVDYPLSPGTASALYFGQRLYQFPLGVFGVALGTVLFPVFAAHAHRQDHAALRQDFSYGLRLVAAVGIPASAGLVLVARPLASLCFERGAFDAADTAQTADMIAAYGSGVWAYCGLLIGQRAFYATGDRQSPLRLSMAAALADLLLNLTLMWWLGGAGMAATTALVASGQCVLTCWAFGRKIGLHDWSAVRVSIFKTLVATAGMCTVGSFAMVSLEAWDVSRFWTTALSVCLATATYFGAATLLRSPEPWDLLFRRRSLLSANAVQTSEADASPE